MTAMRWLVDGYNVIRRSPELAAHERQALEAGRVALCRLLGRAARASGDEFIVVFDGAQGGGTASGGAGVRVVFSSARESADRVLARMAPGGGAVVSNDREVRRAAARAGAIAITTDELLGRLARLSGSPEAQPSGIARGEATETEEGDEEEEQPRGPKKGNPRRLSKKARAAARALRRI